MALQREDLINDLVYVVDLTEVPTAPDGLPRVPVRDHHGFYDRYGKAALDKIGAAVILLLLSPVLLLTAVLVLLMLGRPILLKQQRVGEGGKSFDMLKFRTMHPDRRLRDVAWHGEERRICHKSPHDPRHTPLGRLLRKLSIDELPQLFNVLRGQMSLVGPRPELAGRVKAFQPWQHSRHAVRPGLTGLWQTSAREVGSLSEFIHLDLEYINHMSFRTDMRLLFRTIGVLLRPKTH